MAENVKVIVRCRPMNKKEKEMNCKKIINIDNTSISLINPNDKMAPDKCFTFDHIYDEYSITTDIYNNICYPLVENVIEGYNGTIFAYGQTGCGKSHTMQGPTIINNKNDNRGIISRTFDHIFETISIITDIRYLVLISYLEIYNETIRDLLSIDNINGNKIITNNLLLKELPGYGIVVENLTKHPVSNVTECEILLNNGLNNRIVGKTDMNEVSSRSHSILTIHIEQISSEIINQEGPILVSDNNNNNNVDATTILKKGKLNLVDLAGSERQSKTNTNGERFKEATKINLSLSALGNVISALIDNKTRYIPYRDSKLTRLLQDSLGGNTKTLMIACISIVNYNYDETLSTLRYANRAKNIKNQPIINEDPKDAMLREYHDEIIKLRDLLKLNNVKSDLCDIHEKQERYHQLENEYKEKYNNLLINHNKYENENNNLLLMIEHLKGDYEKKLFHLNNQQQQQQQQQITIDKDNDKEITDTDKKLLKRIKLLKNLTVGGESSNDIKLKEFIYKKKLNANKLNGKIIRNNNIIINNNNDNDNDDDVDDRMMMMMIKNNNLIKTKDYELYVIKLNKKLNSYKYEINDLQSEFQLERNDYLDTIRRNNKYIKFLKQLIDCALPILRKDGRYWDIEIIKRKSLWDDDLMKWKIPDECLARQKLPPAVEDNQCERERENTTVTAPGRLERSSSLISLVGHRNFNEHAPNTNLIYEKKPFIMNNNFLKKKLQLSEVDNIASTYFRPRRVAELLKNNYNTTDTWRDIALRRQIVPSHWESTTHQVPATANGRKLYEPNKFNLNKTWTSTTSSTSTPTTTTNNRKAIIGGATINENIFHLKNKILTTSSAAASSSSTASIILDTNV